jgi:hypothetical protein
VLSAVVAFVLIVAVSNSFSPPALNLVAEFWEVAQALPAILVAVFELLYEFADERLAHQ